MVKPMALLFFFRVWQFPAFQLLPGNPQIGIGNIIRLFLPLPQSLFNHFPGSFTGDHVHRQLPFGCQVIK